MIKKKDISLIIQGPLHSITLENLHLYQDFGEIIISAWTNDDLTKIPENAPKNTKFLLSVLPQDYEINYNYGNFYFQALSSAAGLTYSKFDYSIKLRSDEEFNFDPMINRLNALPNKIVTTNINFVKDSRQKYHCSDHTLLGKTEILKKAFGKCVKMCKTPEAFGLTIDKTELIGKDSQGTKFALHAERLLGYNICKEILHIEPLIRDSRHNMQQCFEIIPLSEMGKFKFSCNSSRHNSCAPYKEGVSRDFFTSNSIYANNIKKL